MSEPTVLTTFGMRPVKPRTIIKTTPSIPIIQNPNLVCGIELEVEGVGIHHVENTPPNWKLVEDHSLRNNGREFVSNPTEVMRLCDDLTEFFKIMQFTEDNYSDRTSVHVHVNVQDFTKAELQSLMVVYALVEKILFQFVGNHRSENLYCVPLNETMLLQNLNHTLDRIFVGDRAPWEKYTALNLKPISGFGTVEFRHMHGTCDVGKLTTWLILISHLFAYCRKYTVADLYAMISKLEAGQYQQWFTDIFPTSLKYDEKTAELFTAGITSTKYLLTQVHTKKKKSQEVYSVPDMALGNRLAELLRAHPFPPSPAPDEHPDTLGGFYRGDPFEGVITGAGNAAPARAGLVRASQYQF